MVYKAGDKIPKNWYAKRHELEKEIEEEKKREEATAKYKSKMHGKELQQIKKDKERKEKREEKRIENLFKFGKGLDTYITKKKSKIPKTTTIPKLRRRK
jgi:hypothetical protein